MDTTKDTKWLGHAGLMLLLLGLASLALVFVANDVTTQTVELAAGAGVLFGLGGSTAAVTGLRRLEARVAVLEKALAARA